MKAGNRGILALTLLALFSMPVSAQFIASRASVSYHKSDCRSARNIKPSNVVTFATASEAEHAGYVACRVCGKTSAASGTRVDGPGDSVSTAGDTAASRRDASSIKRARGPRTPASAGTASRRPGGTTRKHAGARNSGRRATEHPPHP